MAVVAFQIHITLKADKAEQFMAAARHDAQESAKETGCLRFEVFQHADDPLRLVVMEMYASEAALEHHRQQPHVDVWRAAVKECTEEYTRVFLTPVSE
jgi:quinol monooxygenase YgiN